MKFEDLVTKISVDKKYEFANLVFDFVLTGKRIGFGSVGNSIKHYLNLYVEDK